MVLQEESDFHKPPIRVRLFRATPPGPLCHRLVFVLHHALYDGVSIGKLLDMIETIYHGITPTKLVQFSDLLPHFVFQEQNGTSFWVRKLQGYDHLPLPRTGKEIGRTPTTASRYIHLDSSRLGVILRRSGATIQCLAQAAWAKLIASTLNTQDVLFGHVVSGRSLSVASDVIGPVLVRCSVSHVVLLSLFTMFRTRYPVACSSRGSATPTSFERSNKTMWKFWCGSKRPCDPSSVNSSWSHYGIVYLYSNHWIRTPNAKVSGSSRFRVEKLISGSRHVFSAYSSHN